MYYWLLHIQRSFDCILVKNYNYTEREFSNFVDHYSVTMRKDSSDFVPSGFENLFGSDPAHFIVKYSKYKYCIKNLVRNSKSHEIKAVTDFNVANTIRCKNKVLMLKPTYGILVDVFLIAIV